MMNEEISVPEEYICPISLSVMKDPVMSKDGRNFEKRAILDWLNRGNVNCPLTRQPLKPSLLVPNANLKMSIERWRKANGVPDFEDDEECSSSSESDHGFVGLLQMDMEFPEVPPVDDEDDLPSSQQGPITSALDDDLKDLLDLYNEVLELTSMPFDAMPPAREPQRVQVSRFPAPTQEEADAVLGAIVARTARRNWRPKLFPKKVSKST